MAPRGKLGQKTLSRPPPSLQNKEETNAVRDYKGKVREILAKTWFDGVVAGVIVCNAAVIGLEQSLEIDNQNTDAVKVLDHLFLVCYIFELWLRFFAYGCSCLRDRWVKVDAFLVVMGILTSWILVPAIGDDSENFGPIMLIRMARLLRLAKTARVLRRIHEFWMIIRGLVNSAATMIYILIVMFVTLYIFSSLGVELITKHRLNTGSDADEAFQKHVDVYFGSLHGTMLTLCQFICGDNISDVYRVLVEKDGWLCLYFVAIILVVYIMLMHLISGVIFNSILEANQNELDTAKETREHDWANFIGNLKDMFNRLDEDKSGFLTLDEFLDIDAADQKQLCDALKVHNLRELFKILDAEQTGEISINDFFDCILDKVLEQGDANFKRMERQIETMHWRLKELFSAQNDMQHSINCLCQALKNFCPDPDAEAAMTKVISQGGKRVRTNSQSGSRGNIDDLEREMFMPSMPSVERMRSQSSVDKRMDLWERTLSKRLNDMLQECVKVALTELPSDVHAVPQLDASVPKVRSPKAMLRKASPPTLKVTSNASPRPSSSSQSPKTSPRSPSPTPRKQGDGTKPVAKRKSGVLARKPPTGPVSATSPPTPPFSAAPEPPLPAPPRTPFELSTTISSDFATSGSGSTPRGNEANRPPRRRSLGPEDSAVNTHREEI